MKYIWQHKNWPQFEFNTSAVQGILYNYALTTGYLSDTVHNLPHDVQIDATIDLMVSEAFTTSEIEGERLDKQEIRSSIRNQLGLSKKSELIKDPRAVGIAQLMISVRKNFAQPLTKEELFSWHSMIFPQTPHIKSIRIGNWREGKEPMQIISGTIGKEIVHYEAPPSENVNKEMDQFIAWFNATAPNIKKNNLPGPVRAAIAHLFFECIHPFDDGNGRIGRALAEKVLSQELQRPLLFSISSRLQKDRKEYYQQLSVASTGGMNITEWIEYFVKTIYAALLDSQEEVLVIVQKAQFWQQHASQLNERQSKVLRRMFKEGVDGFKGGLNIQKYMTIAECSKDLASNDINELLDYECIEELPGSGKVKSYKIRLQR